MNNVKVLGVDLAKNVFQIHGNDGSGHKIFSKRVKRKNLLRALAKLPPCLVGLEACGGAHYWAREISALGHDARLMSPKYVKPYVTANKNDANDADAIAEAVTRPRTKFVPAKSIEQQELQAIHRIREQQIKQRTALVNQIRGLLAEIGIVIPQGIGHIRKGFYSIIEDGSNNLTCVFRELFLDLYNQFKDIDKRIDIYDKKIETVAKEHDKCRQLLSIRGIGPITATALVAAVGDAHEFSSGRQLAAFLGLVPKQCSSGDKIILRGISKQGNRHLRTLLIHGARAVMRHADKRTDRLSVWIQEKKNRSSFNATSVALANKIARYAWVVLFKDEEFNHAHGQA